VCKPWSWSYLKVKDIKELWHLHLQHRQHTSHEEETSDNRRKTKKPPLPTARITTTLVDWQATNIGGPPKNHNEDILTFFTYETAFLQRICCFYNFIFTICIFISIWQHVLGIQSQGTDVQHVTSLHQVAYVQRIRCIKNSPLKYLIVYLTWRWPVGAETCSE
jgi:hypothetical protein